MLNRQLNLALSLLLTLALLLASAQDFYPPRSFTHYNAGPGTPVTQMEGNRHVFNCEANARPSAVYAWRKGELDRWIRLNDTFTYRITSVNRSDAGLYRCFAFNEYGGLRDLGIDFRVGYFDPPTESSRNVGASLGGALQLALPPVSAYPPPSASWLRNGFRVDEDARHFVSMSSSRLFVLNVSTAENGFVYQAQMTNNYHDTTYINSPTYTLVVTGSTPPARSDPQLLWQSGNFTFQLGSPITSRAIFECVFNARPLEYLRIRWYKADLESPVKSEIIHDGVKYMLEPSYARRLTISNLGQRDQARYVCEGQLVGGGAASSPVASGSAYLIMQQAPTLVPGSVASDVVVSHGSDRQLQCSASGEPQPAILWYRNSVLLSNSSRYTVQPNGLLTIKAMEPADAGIFQCFAVNSVDEKYASWWIRVESSVPKISTPMTNVTKLELEDVSFACVATGAPTPTIQWLKDGTHLTSGGRFLVQSTGSLLITAVQVSDTGRYTCLASNTPGSDQTSGYLNVLQRTKIILPPEKPVESIKGSELEIKCGYSTSPGVAVTVEWYHTPDIGGSLPVRVANDINFREVIQSTGSLRLKSVRTTDAGRYQCFVLSSAGNDTRDTMLTVIELPQSPIIVSALLNPIDNRSIDLVWRPGLTGNTPVTSYSVQLAESSTPDTWNAVATVDGSVTTYRVTNGLLASRTYRFRVLARNKVGESLESKPSANITMPQQPPSGPPQSLFVSQRSNTSLAVSWRAPELQFQNGKLFGYVIQYNIVGYPVLKNVSVTDATATQAVLTSLQVFTEYEVRIAAYNAMGVGVFSNAKRETTAEGVPTDRPSSVSAAAISSTQLQVAFNQPSANQINGINLGYIIAATCIGTCPSPSSKETVIPYDSSKGPTARLTDLTVGGLSKYTEYSLTVACFTSAGRGPLSVPVTVSTLQDVPGPVVDFALSDIVDTQVRLSWRPPADKNGIITGYLVWYKPVLNATGGSSSAAAVSNTTVPLGANATGHLIADLVHQTRYEIGVSASTAIGWGPARIETLVTGVPPELPQPPTMLTVSSIEATTALVQFIPGYDGKASISAWLVDAQVQSEASPWQRLASIPGSVFTTNQLTITGLQPFTRYRIRLTAQNIRGLSNVSLPSNWFETKQAAPASAPANLTVRVVDSRSLSVRWMPLEAGQWNGNAQGYSIRYRRQQNSTTDFTEVSVTDPGSSYRLLDGLIANTKYEVQMTARNPAGSAVTSSVFATTWDATPSAAPSNLALRSKSASTVGLVFDALTVEQASGVILFYTVRWNQSTSDTSIANGSMRVSPSSAVGNSFSENVVNLMPFTQYAFTVSASTRQGEGPSTSSPLLVVTEESAPADPPRLVYCPQVTSDSVLVAWLPPRYPGSSTISSWRLKYGVEPSAGGSGGVTFVEVSVPGSQLNRLLTGLVSEAQYLLQLAAVNAKGVGPYANASVQVYAARTRPEAPSVPLIISSAVTATSIDISWTPKGTGYSPIRNYTLLVISSANNWTIDRPAASGTSATVAGLLPSYSYSFQVRATNDIGPSDWSKPTNASWTKPSGPVSSPEIDRLTPLDPTTVRVEWTPMPLASWRCGLNCPAGVARQIRVLFTPRSGDSGLPVTADVPDPSSNVALVGNLTRGVYYEVSLLAISAYGAASRASRLRLVYVGEAVPTAAPSKLRCIASGGAQIYCNWTAPPKEQQNGVLLGYRLYYRRLGSPGEVPLDDSSSRSRRAAASAASADSGSVAVAGAKSASAIDRLKLYSVYGVAAAAFNPAGEGPNSTEVRVVTSDGPPGPVDGLRIVELTPTEAKAVWSAPLEPNGNVTKYRLAFTRLLATDGSGERNVEVFLDPSQTSYRAEGLAESAYYQFRVAAQTQSAWGWGPDSKANATTGPVPGSPSRPVITSLAQTEAGVSLQWSYTDGMGSVATTGAVVQGFLRDSGQPWRTLQRFDSAGLTACQIAWSRLTPPGAYQLRVVGVNNVGISEPSEPSRWVYTPGSGLGPFYEQWWFLVILGLAGLIIINLVITLLYISGRRRSSKLRKRQYNADTNSHNGHLDSAAARLAHPMTLGSTASGVPASIPPNGIGMDAENSLYRFHHPGVGASSSIAGPPPPPLTSGLASSSSVANGTYERHQRQLHHRQQSHGNRKTPRPSPASVMSGADGQSDVSDSSSSVLPKPSHRQNGTYRSSAYGASGGSSGRHYHHHRHRSSSGRHHQHRHQSSVCSSSDCSCCSDDNESDFKKRHPMSDFDEEEGNSATDTASDLSSVNNAKHRAITSSHQQQQQVTYASLRKAKPPELPTTFDNERTYGVPQQHAQQQQQQQVQQTHLFQQRPQPIAYPYQQPQQHQHQQQQQQYSYGPARLAGSSFV
ncbi:hypothetical protein BOX15_Mlig000533g1 [Macrostomum lignano]|uniref:Protein-tyrosine-phosphatase n=2 Tax=Macrostomum lignano TaxID=282301 RepID=A0A267GW28_9PLAT|nr:hypothetical protein BOX15_Mlig000533g1 [Macrostomum lignano]